MLQQYKNIFNQYKDKRKELEDLESADQALLQRLDLMKFQFEELTEASLKEDEVEQLEVDIKRIQNSEKLSLALNNAHQVLTDENAIPDRLYELSNHLQSINDIVPEKYEKLKEDIDQFYYVLEDAKHDIYDEMANTEFDEQVLNELESRMNLLNNLKRKYGKDVPELIDNGIRKFNVGTELLVTWTETAKKYFGETKVNKSLRHNIIPCNEAVKNIVAHKINLFMNKERVKV